MLSAGLLLLNCGIGRADESNLIEVERIRPGTLVKMLDKPDVLVLDVRSHGDWVETDRKVKGALREDPGEIDSWAGKYPKDKTYVLYCS